MSEPDQNPADAAARQPYPAAPHYDQTSPQPSEQCAQAAHPPYPQAHPQPYPQPWPPVRYDPYAGAGQWVQYPDPYARFHPPQPGRQAEPPTGPSRGRRTLVGAAAVVAAAALVASGFGIGRAVDRTDGNGSVAGGQDPTQQDPTQQQPTFQLPDLFPGGGSGGGTGSGRSSNPTATATQQKGIVTIVSTLGYQNAQSAGTGMILSSDGEVLTNNHVISGATSIRVTDETTDKSYRATVVGTSPANDVAVLKLSNASGLTTARVGDASDVSDLRVGDAVTGVGNGGGTGTLTAASGKVTALERTITATDEDGSNSERLTGLIQTDAPIVAGDSGGPLYDSDGDVVGIDTAAATGNGTNTGRASVAYAIPIDDALTLADQIERGVETSSVHIGLPAFIGVGVADATTGNGAGITSVLENGPAAKAGITAGSVITAVGGKSVNDAASLKTRLAAYEPGQKVTLTWNDTQGRQRTATVTLATGPAD
ncbi:S1C family serine protease [Jatrophihabitans fulvus]